MGALSPLALKHPACPPAAAARRLPVQTSLCAAPPRAVSRQAAVRLAAVRRAAALCAPEWPAVIEVIRKRNEFAARLFRPDPDRLLAAPAARDHVAGETGEIVRGQYRLLKRERMIGARHEHQFAVGDMDAQRLLKRAGREKIKFAVEDQSRDLDRRELRRHRFELEEKFHQILQGVDIVQQPSPALGGFQPVHLLRQPVVGQIHREKQIHQKACAAKNKRVAHRRAKQKKLRRQFGKAGDRHEARDHVRVLDGVAQRNHATEADPRRERPVASCPVRR